MNKNMPDGNTAALRIYELEQDERFLAAEIAQADKDAAIESLIIADLEGNGESSKEAMGTQATLTVLDKGNGWELGTELKEFLAAAISSPSEGNDAKLGKCIRQLAYEYMANDFKDFV
tara:strand:+ start:725 stop:1078 length:354 start_codon:yes stop_codon:yes gene_type:complete